MIEHQRVASFVGLDAHFENCTLHAIDIDRQVLLDVDVSTGQRALRKAIQSLPQPVWVMLESSQITAFVKRCLAPVVDRVIACETRHNRWISGSDHKSDAADARHLAELLRLRSFTEVHVPAPQRQELRDLMAAYQKVVQDLTRAKCRLRAVYGSQGLIRAGQAMYDPTERKTWLEKVRSENIRIVLETHYDLLAAAEAAQEKLAKRLKQKLSAAPEYGLLRTIPGVGDIVAAIFVVVIDNPSRFANKHKLWSYASLGVRQQSSGASGRVKSGGAHHGNRLLKYAAMVAAHNAIKGDNRFARHYQTMLARQLAPGVAKKTIARGILAAAWSMWKSGSEYRDDIQSPETEG